MSDPALRARRDEWINANVFDRPHSDALTAFDRVVGLDLTEVAIDGPLHKAQQRRRDGPKPDPVSQNMYHSYQHSGF